MDRKCIEVEFLPGERVVVKPRGFTQRARTGYVHKVCVYAGGCRSYTVRCEAESGEIYSINVGADELGKLE